MPENRILFGSYSCVLMPGETVLDGLLRAGAAVPNGCRSGVCQSCRLKATSGAIPKVAQVGLRPSEAERGIFLSCLCRPNESLDVELPNESRPQPARIQRVEALEGNVLRVEVDAGGFEIVPGQFLHLVREDGLRRAYSVNQVGDSVLVLHVEELPGGKMSGWLRAAEGRECSLVGPFGDVVYRPEFADKDIVCVGTGTGLSPLWGMLRNAGAHGRKKTLYFGASSVSRLYLRSELTAFCKAEGVDLVLSAFDSSGQDEVSAVPIEDLIERGNHNPMTTRYFLCGAPGFVRGLRKKLYLSGTPLDQILSDPFEAFV